MVENDINTTVTVLFLPRGPFVNCGIEATKNQCRVRVHTCVVRTLHLLKPIAPPAPPRFSSSTDPTVAGIRCQSTGPGIGKNIPRRTDNFPEAELPNRNRFASRCLQSDRNAKPRTVGGAQRHSAKIRRAGFLDDQIGHVGGYPLVGQIKPGPQHLGES